MRLGAVANSVERARSDGVSRFVADARDYLTWTGRRIGHYYASAMRSPADPASIVSTSVTRTCGPFDPTAIERSDSSGPSATVYEVRQLIVDRPTA